MRMGQTIEMTDLKCISSTRSRALKHSKARCEGEIEKVFSNGIGGSDDPPCVAAGFPRLRSLDWSGLI